MSKKILFFALLSFTLLCASAQYCGNSGTFQCTASNLPLPWLSPPPDSLPPFVNGMPSTTVIQFKNFNTVFFNGNQITVNWLRIDTIDNLPSGLCWASNKANNTYLNQENGCIKINGIPCDATGQYKMRIIVTIDIGVGTVQVNADQAGLKYFVRLKNNGDADTPVDSNQTAANAFIPYGGQCTAQPLVADLGTDQLVCNGSINTLQATVAGGQAPYSMLWSSAGNALSCSQCEQPQVTLTQNSTFMVAVTDANQVTVYDTVEFAVFGTAGSFQINASGSTTFCEGGNVLLQGNTNAGCTYQWLANNANVAGATGTSLSVSNSGNYYLVFTNPAGCYATSNVIAVTAVPKPEVTITQTPPSACTGDTVQLTAVADSSVQHFIWAMPGGGSDTTAAIVTLNQGSYSVQVQSVSNCYDTAFANLVFHALPQVTVSGNQDSVCNNYGLLTLTGGSPAGGIYSGNGISNNELNPAIGGIGPRIIHYTFTDSNTCANSSTEVISVVVCTGIEQLDADAAVLLYPNPAGDYLVVEWKEPVRPPVLHIYDVAGSLQPVTAKTERNKTVLDVAHLPPGIYQLQIQWGKKTTSRKWIKHD